MSLRGSRRGQTPIMLLATLAVLFLAVTVAQRKRTLRRGRLQVQLENIRATSVQVGFTNFPRAHFYQISAKEWIDGKREQSVATSERKVGMHQRSAVLYGLASGREYLVQVQALNNFGKPLGSPSERVFRTLIRCYECNGRASNAECNKNRPNNCPAGTDACLNEMRYQNGIITHTKRCAQFMPVLAKKIRNGKDVTLACRGVHAKDAVCKCMCKSDVCNAADLPCGDTCNEKLKSPKNGWVECKAGNRVNDKCNWKCAPGTTPHGVTETRCRTDRTWSVVTPPKCVKPVPRPTQVKDTTGRPTAIPEYICPELDPKLNVKISCNYGRSRGSDCTHTCEGGYRLFGSIKRTCQSTGRWTGTPASCQLITCKLPRASSKLVMDCTNNNAVGSICEISCSDNLSLNGPNRVTCYIRGTWSRKLPKCEKTAAAGRGCQARPRTASNVISECHDYTSPREGAMCEYSCKPGFVMRGKSTSTCTNNKWSNMAPSCHEIRCRPAMRQPSFGMVRCSRTNRYRSTCTFSCNNNYVLYGSDKSTCGAAGTWGSRAPTCEKVSCPPINQFNRGSYSCNNGRDLKSVCNFRCISGYGIPSGVRSTLVCVAPKTISRSSEYPGRWNSKIPTCALVRCPPIKMNDHLLKTCNKRDDRSVGTTCRFRCEKGFFRAGRSSTTCRNGARGRALGRWSTTLVPKCIRISCRKLTRVYNGDVSCTDGFFAGSTCNVECAHGYRTTGTSSEVVCNNDGRWNRVTPRCTRVICKTPRRPTVQNFVFECGKKLRDPRLNSFFLDFECPLSCRAGFTIIGGNSTKCGQTGEWELSQSMTCQDTNECDFDNGDCEQDCNNLVGSRTCSCGENYRLNADGVTCRLVVCPAFAPDPHRTQICPTGLSISSECYLSCDVGYEPYGGATVVTCVEGGAWNQRSASCRKVTCPELTRLANGMRICSEGNRFESVCSSFCDEGYTLEGAAETACTSESTWSHTAPKCTKIQCPAGHTSLSNGRVSCIEANFYLSTCRYFCHSGYKYAGVADVSVPAKAATCQSDGRWDFEAPSCEKARCEQTVEDMQLLRPISEMSCTEDNLFESTCSITCPSGYKMIGQSRTTCTSTQTWTPTLGYCAKIECPALTVPRDGAVECTDGVLFESVCNFTCSVGHDLIGQKASRCQADRHWSERPPRCQRVVCDESRMAIDHGSVTCTDENYYDSKCTASCSQGWEFDAPTVRESTRKMRVVRLMNASRGGASDFIYSRCLATALWDVSPPRCERISCLPSNEFLYQVRKNGQVTCSNGNLFESRCVLRCDVGYEIVNGGDVTTCGPLHEWTSELGYCQKVQCAEFDEFHNGLMTCTEDNSYESVCEFACNPGYELVGESSSTCQADRTFTNQQPKCQKITCPKTHTALENGNATCSDGRRFQSRCIYVCDAGYEMTTSPDADVADSDDVTVLTCQADRTWGGDLPYCKRKQCSMHDGSITRSKLNGVVNCSESAWFGSRCSVTCNQGYYLIGPSSTFCTASADWAPTLGYCEKIECSSLVAPANSEMTCSDGFRFESSCTVECSRGYERIGAASASCLADGTYTNELPTCKEIICPIRFTTLNNGVATCSDSNRFASTCTYRCDPGYQPTLASVARATCLVTYRWDAQTKPACEKRRCMQADPILVKALEHGAIVCSDENRFESRCDLTCDEGYELTGGQDHTTCLADQTWDSSFGYCKKVTCPAFSAPDNGDVSCSQGAKFQSVCTFVCSPGYEMVGEPSSTCQADRTFTNPKPSCKRITCPESQLSIDNGATQCTMTNLYESVCTYECEPGYEVVAGEVSATCQDDRTWTAPKALCEKKMCANVDENFVRADRNGVVTCSDGHLFDSRCSLACDVGYKLAEGTSDTTRCNEDATWGPTIGYCVKKSCQAFAALDNGRTNCSESNLFLSRCEFECVDGYEMVGSASSVCQSSKNWTSPKPDCYKISCSRSFLTLIDGQSNCSDSNRFESECTYECNEGYKMASTDSKSTTCTASKMWSRMQPTCLKKQCPVNDASLVKAAEKGTVTCTEENLYESTCSVACPAGYELVGGSRDITCLASAAWNGTMGYCQKIRCEIIMAPANSEMDCEDSNRFESVCSFECDEGYYMEGEAKTVCQADATYSNPVPKCKKISCSSDHMNIDFGTVDCSEASLFESVCAYQCQLGYQFFGSDVIADDVMTATCQADSSWSSVVPICEKVTCPHDDEDFVEAHETGQVTCTEGNRYGSTCTVTCKTGSEVIGADQATCTNTGAWNTSLGHCEVNQCPLLVAPFFGDLNCSDGHAFESRCVFSCSSGYQFTAESWDMVLGPREPQDNPQSEPTITAACRADKSWTVSGSPECERKVCPTYGWDTLENGEVSCSEGQLFGSRCLFQCNPGYEIRMPRDNVDMTSVMVTCGSDAEWDVQDPPTCVRIQCQQNVTELQSLEPHGRVTCTNEAFFGSECTLKCNKGYHLVTDYNTTVCESTREWSVVLAACEKNSCEPLDDPTYGSLTCTDGEFFKSHCYLKCDPGYQIVDPEDEYDVNSGVTCRSDGSWCGDIPECEKMSCPKEQTSLRNGQVNCSESNFYLSLCQYSCDLGYHMIQGQSAVAVCESSGQWSEATPVCENNRCPANETSLLESQVNGDVTCTNENKFGSRCLLKCYDGYQMTGEPTTACLHTGEWSNGIGLCQRIRCPVLSAAPDSILECSNEFRYQSLCRSKCDAGFERMTSLDDISDVNHDAKCEMDGTWTGALKLCQKKSCPWSGYHTLANGHVQCTDANLYQSTCVYICEPGYEMRASTGHDTTRNVVNCTADAKWDSEAPVCEPSQCRPTLQDLKQNVTDGTLVCTNGSAFGSSCSVKCECGYQRVSGSSETVCQRSGNWWPPLANCQRIECPAPQAPAHTRVGCTDGHVFDSTCSSTGCDEGYMLTSEDDDIITCAGEGQWLGMLPACKKRECSATYLTLEHGSSICSDANNYGSTCDFSCQPGFVIALDRQVAQCLGTGEWSVEAPTCVRRLSCSSTYFPHGSVECARDGRCQLSCGVGTVLVGNGESTCSDEAPGAVRWEPALGMCKKQSCRTLSQPANGFMHCSDHMRYRSSCRFRCVEGFRVAGPMTTRCRADGSWTSSAPLCVVRTCPASYLTIESGVAVATDSTNNGSVTSYACDQGFELIGSSNVTCLSSGFWNKAKPTCQRLTCPLLNLDNGRVECSAGPSTRQGVTCSFSCKDQFELQGQTSSTCQTDGTWSNPTPYCRGHCDIQFDESVGGINCTNGHYHRSHCRFWCPNSGSDVTTELHGSAVVTCQEDGRWSSAPPCCASRCPDHAKIDLYVVLDSSASVGFKNWTDIVEFVNTFLSSFTIGPRDTQVGVLRYNRDVDLKGEIPLGSIESLSSLQHAITFLPYGGHGTNTGRALSFVAQNSFSLPSNRPDARDYVMLITDGASQDDVADAAVTLRKRHITTYAVGVGNRVNREQLRTIASKPEYAYTTDGNNLGIDQQLVQTVTDSLCDNPCLMQNSWRKLASTYLDDTQG